jgi:hypothetical protein
MVTGTEVVGSAEPIHASTESLDPPDASPQLGIWSRALAKVATEPGVLFHVLRTKPKLVGSAAGNLQKRKRDDE